MIHYTSSLGKPIKDVCIGDRVKVGNQVILHHGVSLGADGFSFVTENPNNIEQWLNTL